MLQSIEKLYSSKFNYYILYSERSEEASGFTMHFFIQFFKKLFRAVKELQKQLSRAAFDWKSYTDCTLNCYQN